MALKDAARLDRPCDLALDTLRPKPNGLSTPFLLSDWKRANKYRRSPPTRSLDQTFPSLLTHMSPPSNGHRTLLLTRPHFRVRAERTMRFGNASRLLNPHPQKPHANSSRSGDVISCKIVLTAGVMSTYHATTTAMLVHGAFEPPAFRRSLIACPENTSS